MNLRILMLLLWAGYASGADTNGIPHFAVVEPGIYRGGQPTNEAGWKYLASLGVSNVVKLNLEREASDAPAEALGMRIVRVPIPTEEQLLGPVHPEQIREATAAIRPGTFVHCEHGQDRTGLIVAIHRVQADGWTKADAEGEMLAHGFHKQLHGLWEYWESFRLERPRETTNETSVPR